MRLHEVCKKYKLSNKEMAALLESLGFPGKSNPLSAVNNEMLTALEKYFAQKEGKESKGTTTTVPTQQHSTTKPTDSQDLQNLDKPQIEQPPANLKQYNLQPQTKFDTTDKTAIKEEEVQSTLHPPQKSLTEPLKADKQDKFQDKPKLQIKDNYAIKTGSYQQSEIQKLKSQQPQIREQNKQEPFKQQIPAQITTSQKQDYFEIRKTKDNHQQIVAKKTSQPQDDKISKPSMEQLMLKDKESTAEKQTEELKGEIQSLKGVTPLPQQQKPIVNYKPSQVFKEEKKKGGPKPPRIDDEEEVEVNQQITIIKTGVTRREPSKKLKKKLKAKKQSSKGQYSAEDLSELIEPPQQLLKQPDIKQPEEQKPEEQVPHIVVPQELSVSELAKYLDVSPIEIIKKLMGFGVIASLNQRLDSTQIQLVGKEFGKEISFSEDVIDLEEQPDPPEALKPRPPVVTIMGHVDHGKTSLLDRIRKTKVAEGEVGGITQHIGAYQVKTPNGAITFLDTPGHEAFTAMRAQGAQVTDIAVLVVAADEGVQPQTVEAIHHAQAAGVPIIVAINKIDKPEASPERVKQMLIPYNLVAEDWGGKTIMVPVSAKRGDGIDELLEMILLQAEIMELKANPNKKGRGVIIEAKLDKGMGPVATVLVKNGTIRVGDNIVCGTCYGRVKALINDNGERIKEATPSMPVAVLGLSDVPKVGDKLIVVEDARFARYVSVLRQKKEREERLARENRTKLVDLFKQVTDGKRKELPIIIKADVQGSALALKDALERLSTAEVRVVVLHSGVGAITESDVMLASASNALIIGFHVRPAPGIEEIAKREDVEIKVFRIIYDAIDAVKKALKGLYEPVFEEEIIGRAEVRKTFKISGVGIVAGCYVVSGKVSKDASVRIIRDGVEIYEGKVASLKRFKDDVREVVAGFECGIAIENYQDIKENDLLEFFNLKKVEREIINENTTLTQ